MYKYHVKFLLYTTQQKKGNKTFQNVQNWTIFRLPKFGEKSSSSTIKKAILKLEICTLTCF